MGGGGWQTVVGGEQYMKNTGGQWVVLILEKHVGWMVVGRWRVVVRWMVVDRVGDHNENNHSVRVYYSTFF